MNNELLKSIRKATGKPDLNPSEHQSKFLDWVANGTGSALLVAVAGAGKTATLLMATHVIQATQPEASVQVLVFAKKNADEMKSKFPQKVFTGTFHSAWFGAYRKFAGNVEVNDKKVWNLIDDVIKTMAPSEDDFKVLRNMYGSFVRKLVGFAKAEGVGYIIDDEISSWSNMINHHNLSLDHEGASVSEAIEIARKVLVANNKKLNVIDFDDMLYMPLINEVGIWKKDFIFVDEAQDTNPVQRALLRRMVKKGGRVVAVGDPMQAIFGFRGATADAMDHIKRTFNAVEFLLPVTYRNPKSVVALAKQLVPHIEPRDGAEEGSVNNVGALPINELGDDDVILCRNTAPLVVRAYILIAQGKGCKILGRDIGENLIKIINSMKAKGVDKLLDKLDAWKNREMEKAIAKDNESLASSIEDKYDSIIVIINTLDENNRTVPALIAKIEKMFTDNGGRMLTLSTVHKAKGLEWKNVYIVRPDLMPSKWAKTEWMQEQERNLEYVAYTRTLENLTIVNEILPGE